MRRGLLCAAGAVLGGVVAYRRLVRPWQERWGATEEEARRPLPGDELLHDADDQVTRAITIQAPAEEVWRWLVQIGADRGGFYSYDVLENLFGLGIHSAETIVPEWQERAVGDLVYAEAKGSGGWYVVDVRPGEGLVLALADVKSGRPVRREDPAGWEFLWNFALLPADDGATRLVVRERVAFENPAMRAAMAPVGLVSFVMTRKMLLGIKERAEGAAARLA